MTAKRLKTLIIDDEPLAREGLSIILKNFPAIEMIGESENGTQALADIQNLSPDLIFLDIEMPDMSGFDVISKLAPEQIPSVVFVTAYNQYAIKAFEIHAVDYLLKPINRELVKRAVNRITSNENQNYSAQEIKKLQQLIQSLPDPMHHQNTPTALNDRFSIKSDGKVMFLKKEQIPLIEANGDYVTVHYKGKKYLVHDKLKRLEEVLKDSGFIRIHRSFLINSNCIESIQNSAFGEYQIKLEHCHERIHSSRSYHKLIQQLTHSGENKPRPA